MRDQSQENYSLFLPNVAVRCVSIMILKKVMICNLLLMSIALAAVKGQAPRSVSGNTCMSSTDKSSKECVSITCQGNMSHPTTITATGQKTDSTTVSCKECPSLSTSTGLTPVCSVNCTIGSSSLQPITVSGEPKVSQNFVYDQIKLFQQTELKMTHSQVSRIFHLQSPQISKYLLIFMHALLDHGNTFW